MTKRNSNDYHNEIIFISNRFSKLKLSIMKCCEIYEKLGLHTLTEEYILLHLFWRTNWKSLVSLVIYTFLLLVWKVILKSQNYWILYCTYLNTLYIFTYVIQKRKWKSDRYQLTYRITSGREKNRFGEASNASLRYSIFFIIVTSIKYGKLSNLGEMFRGMAYIIFYTCLNVGKFLN